MASKSTVRWLDCGPFRRNARACCDGHISFDYLVEKFGTIGFRRTAQIECAEPNVTDDDCPSCQDKRCGVQNFGCGTGLSSKFHEPQAFADWLRDSVVKVH